MPLNLQRRQELFLDGVEESFKFLRLAYTRLVDTVLSYAPDSNDAKLLDAVVLDCWVIVDFAKRLRTLLERTPGLKKTPELRVFLTSTSELPDFRNYVQHLEDEVKDVAPTGLPIWGSVSWIRRLADGEVAVRVYGPGRLAKVKGIPVAIAEPLHDVDHVALSVNRRLIHLSELVRRIERLEVSFTAAVAAEEKADKRDENGLIRFKLTGPN